MKPDLANAREFILGNARLVDGGGVNERRYQSHEVRQILDLAVGRAREVQLAGFKAHVNLDRHSQAARV